jgi:hypothetical protein
MMHQSSSEQRTTHPFASETTVNEAASAVRGSLTKNINKHEDTLDDEEHYKNEQFIPPPSLRIVSDAT